MEKKRVPRLGIVAVLLVSLMIVLLGNATAQLEKPRWHEGDYWEYDFSSFGEPPLSGKNYMEVNGIKTITIEGKQYEARMVTYHAKTLNSPSVEVERIEYWRESDMAIMKYVEDKSIGGHEEAIYTPPLVEMDWPIIVDKEWERHLTVTITNPSGTEKEEINFYYKCIGKTDVTTKAGLFACYISELPLPKS
jgi:hypothetical protein